MKTSKKRYVYTVERWDGKDLTLFASARLASARLASARKMAEEFRASSREPEKIHLVRWVDGAIGGTPIE